MMQLEVPHINVLTKVDLLKRTRQDIGEFLLPDAKMLENDLHASMGDRFRRLNTQMAGLVRAL